MKAVQFLDGEVKAVDVDFPEAQGEDWDTLSVSSAGICGSDLHMADIGIFPPNITIGHEFCGTLPDGTLAAVEPIIPCGTCDRCEEGRYNICVDIMSSIAGMGRDGGMAEAVLVHKSQIVPLPGGVTLESGFLVEPLAVCIHGYERLNFPPEEFSGMKVAIIGGGTIGQCALAVAKSYGAQVTLFSRHPAQKQAAEKLGSQAEKEQYDLVIDSAGTESALAQAVSLARPGAKMLLLATYWAGMVLPGTELCMKEIDVVPAIMYCSGVNARHNNNKASDKSHRHGDDFIQAAELLAKTPELPDAIITHSFELSEAQQAFKTASDRLAGAIKVALVTVA